MASFIENFYYRKVDPQKRHAKDKEEAEHQAILLGAKEEYLIQRLGSKEKEVFMEYIDLWREVQDANNLASFITGFRMGANFTYDTFMGQK